MSTIQNPASDAALFAPLTHWHEGDPHGHVVQFYTDDAFLLDTVSKFIGAALGAGDCAVIDATWAHREGLSQRLKARGFDIGSATQQGRYLALDADETLSRFMVAAWPNADRFAEVVGGIIAVAKAAAESKPPRVAVFGEMVSRLWSEGKPEAAVRLEELWNELSHEHSFSLHCAYPIMGFNRNEHGEPFLKICAEHSGIIPDESYSALICDEDRLRSITFLQQKAQALETEAAERKEAQKSLQRREAELADVLENAVQGAQQVGPDQKILWANKALMKLLGYAAEEYVGVSLAEFHVHRDIFDEFWRRLMRGEDIYNYPAELRCKNGSVKHVLVHSNGLWENGEFVHTRCFIRDVTEQKRVEDALRLAQEELELRVHERTLELEQKNRQILEQAAILEIANQGLRELSAGLLQVQDEERRRIARDLHDSTGQCLALLSMNLRVLEMESAPLSPDLARKVAENGEIVRQISSELRTISYLLHPPLLDEMGLESALRWYVDGFRQRSNIEVNLELPGDMTRLSRNLETAIFRIVQEGLTNIHRHSESPTANIRLYQSSGNFILEIKDAGKGICPEKLIKIASAGVPGVGLRGMRERIKDFDGEFTVSSHEKGTQIKVVIPPASFGAQSQPATAST